METTDYRELLADWQITKEGVGYGVSAILATHIPSLCPDCEPIGPLARPCRHHDAPTIGDLLRWGENVAKAEPDFDRLIVNGAVVGPTAADLLAALRTEADR